jgi:CRISPR-associated protein Cmr1
MDRMREEEGELFGSAADGKGTKSRLRMRLNRWDHGKMTEWKPLGKVTHPEVNNGMSVDSGLYLGFGPVVLPRGQSQPQLKSPPALQAEESAILKGAFPEKNQALLDRAFELMGWFGALGGRSRNGWGSFMLLGANDEEPLLPLREWQRCLDRDWPHAIGSDDRGALRWWTEAATDWEQLIKQLAALKIGFRTAIPFKTGKTVEPEIRHYLSYPVTKHSVKSWPNNYRLPNALHFKVWKDLEGALYGLIYHMPCKPPEIAANEHQIAQAWTSVHQFLDEKLGR